jgi:hypothetical protein
MTYDSDRYIVTYAPIAAMSIFVDVLIHPERKQAESDLQLLAAAIGTVQSTPVGMSSNESSADETGHIQDIVTFMMELVRLGNRAVWRAKRRDNSERLTHLTTE